MLKIKNDVPLERLKDFGFEWNDTFKEYQIFSKGKSERLCIADDNHILIEDFSGFYIIEYLDVLFDLIKSDLVEKVEE